jgi:curved DNA-binding protein CbpA
MRLDSCYKLLSLDEECSDLEVRTAYRRHAKFIHPDKKVIKNESSRLKFSELNEAYKSIINHRKRLNKIKFKIINEYEK